VAKEGTTRTLRECFMKGRGKGIRLDYDREDLRSETQETSHNRIGKGKGEGLETFKEVIRRHSR